MKTPRIGFPFIVTC